MDPPFPGARSLWVCRKVWINKTANGWRFWVIWRPLLVTALCVVRKRVRDWGTCQDLRSGQQLVRAQFQRGLAAEKGRISEPTCNQLKLTGLSLVARFRSARDNGSVLPGSYVRSILSIPVRPCRTQSTLLPVWAGELLFKDKNAIFDVILLVMSLKIQKSTVIGIDMHALDSKPLPNITQLCLTILSFARFQPPLSCDRIRIALLPFIILRQIMESWHFLILKSGL